MLCDALHETAKSRGINHSSYLWTAMPQWWYAMKLPPHIALVIGATGSNGSRDIHAISTTRKKLDLESPSRENLRLPVQGLPAATRQDVPAPSTNA